MRVDVRRHRPSRSGAQRRVGEQSAFNSGQTKFSLGVRASPEHEASRATPALSSGDRGVVLDQPLPLRPLVLQFGSCRAVLTVNATVLKTPNKRYSPENGGTLNGATLA